jgi:hypothetical protein
MTSVLGSDVWFDSLKIKSKNSCFICNLDVIFDSHLQLYPIDSGQQGKLYRYDLFSPLCDGHVNYERRTQWDKVFKII